MIWFPLVDRATPLSPATPTSFEPATPDPGSRVPREVGRAIMEGWR